MVPTIGRIVLYTLTEHDAIAINKRRADAHAHITDHQRHATGVVVHTGNTVSAGDVYPLVITRTWGEDTPDRLVNGQLLLDGNDTYWVTSVSDGQGPGRFAWPSIATSTSSKE